jgi:hypothetical protein
MPSRPSWLPAAGLVLVAIVAWAPAFLAPEALYWDDWANSNGDSAIRLYTQSGLPWNGYFATALFAIGPIAFKVVGFVSTVVIGWAVWRIADAGFGLDAGGRWLLAAFVIALPLDGAHVAVAVLTTYSVSAMIFLLAWVLLVERPPRESGFGRRAGAALLFFVSFSTASLLPFVVLPLLHVAYLLWQDERRLRPVVTGVLSRFWPVIAAPVAFWVMRSIFFKPSGVYAEYNAFISLALPLSRTALIAGAALVVAIACLAVLVLLLLRPAVVLRARALPVRILLGGSTLAAAAWIWQSGPPGSAPASTVAVLVALSAGASLVPASRAVRVLATQATGLVVLALGILPYLLVEKVPAFGDWDSRHQLLMPFGVAILLLAALTAARSPRTGRLATIAGAAALAVAAAVSCVSSLSLAADWRAQQQVIALLAADPQVRDASTVVFVDERPPPLFGDLRHRFYEYSGWLHAAFDQETRFGVDRRDVAMYLDGFHDPFIADGERYGIADFVPSSDGVLVRIEQDPGTTLFDLLVGRSVTTIEVTPVPVLAELADVP